MREGVDAVTDEEWLAMRQAEREREYRRSFWLHLALITPWLILCLMLVPR